MSMIDGPIARDVLTEVRRDDYHGIEHEMTRLGAAVERFSQLVPSLESRLSPILVEGAPVGRIRQAEPMPPRSPFAAVASGRADQIEEILDALDEIITRVDL